MKCILLWSIVNLFLYKCPKLAQPPAANNCTQVHEGTYDQEFILMCSQTLESFVTTTPTPTESSTTLPPVSTTLAPQSTEPSHATTHALTTLPVYLTTTTLSNPSQTTTPSYTSTPTSTSTHIQTTTHSPTKDQIAFNRNASTFIQKTNTIIEKESKCNGVAYRHFIDQCCIFYRMRSIWSMVLQAASEQ